jgi:hypothetical protein
LPGREADVFWHRWDEEWDVAVEKAVRTASGPVELYHRLVALGARPSFRLFLAVGVVVGLAGGVAFVAWGWAASVGLASPAAFDAWKWYVGGAHVIAVTASLGYAGWRGSIDV